MPTKKQLLGDEPVTESSFFETESSLVSLKFDSIPSVVDVHEFELAVGILEKKILEREMEGNFDTALDIDESKNRHSTFLLSVNYDELQNLTLAQQLDDFDLMVQNAIGTLITEGHEIVTCSQIYRILGGTSRPGAASVKKIRDSLIKLSSTKVSLDCNSPDSPINYSFMGHTVDIQFVSASARNTFVDAAIIIKGVPPLMQFSRQRGQLVKVPVELLQSPISKVNLSLRVQGYLLSNIEMWRSSGMHTKTILVSEVLDELHIVDKQARTKAKKDILTLLDFYREKQLNIKDYFFGDVKKNKVTLSLRCEKPIPK